MGKRVLLWLIVSLSLIGCIGASEPADAPAPPTTVVPTPVVNETIEPDTPAPTPAESAPAAASTATPTASPWSTEPDPLQIEEMRQRDYPGSTLTFEETLPAGGNYSQYIVSYLSDGYKVYALMTVPYGETPDTGWPVIVFNHGYIAPSQYRTTERYVTYVDALASSGYIVFKSDYRNHGRSEGDGEVGGGYGTPDYTADVLNAIASLKTYEDADPDRIGMWGHSLGGQITLRAMVVSQDVDAGVIWGGVVAPYPAIIDRWDFVGRSQDGDASEPPDFPHPDPPPGAFRWGSSFSSWVEEFTAKYGTDEENPDFWTTISPNAYLTDLSGPIQLHHSVTDGMVPIEWAETLTAELDAIGYQPYYEIYTYEGDNHDIAANFGLAMQRTIAFFDLHVKEQ